MNSNFIDKQIMQTKFISILDNLEAKLEKINFAISNQKNFLDKNSYQLLSTLLTGNDKYEKVLFNELLNTCFQLELKSHGSSFYFIKAFILFAKEFVKNEELIYSNVIKENEDNSIKYLSTIMDICYPANKNDISSFVDKITQDKVISTVIKEATDLAGIEGNILVEGSNIQNILIELQFGYNFKISSFKGFIPAIGSWDRSNVKILLVDGLIEKVSELDKILSNSFATKIPLVLMAQGFSEEIIATLYSNNVRGSFDIMPIKLEQTLETLNVLNDIAVVSNCDVIGSLKGEMITFVDYNNLPIVDKISLTGNCITIHNNKTRPNVISHLNYLQNRKREQEINTSISDLSDLTTKRIQNLLSHIVKISLPTNDLSKIQVKIDNAIRACRTIYTYGFCDPAKIDTKSLNKEWEKVHCQMIKELTGDKVPSMSFYFAMRFAANLAANYFSSSGIVIMDE